jgi:hypothetical protein
MSFSHSFSHVLTAFTAVFSVVSGSIFAQSSAQSDIRQELSRLCGISNISLNKTAETQSLTSYSNAAFNISYTAPAGWSFATPSVSSSGVMFSVSSPSYSATVLIASIERNDSYASAYLGPNWCHQRNAYCYAQSPSQSPYVFFCSDSTYANTGNHLAWQQVKYLDDHSEIQCDFCMQNGPYTLICSFATTVADYNLNSSEYIGHVLALTWYGSGVAKSLSKQVAPSSELTFQNKQVSFTLMKNQQARLDAFTVKGQLVGTLYNGLAKGTTAVSTEHSLKADQAYVLRLQTEENQSILKIQKSR